MGILADRPRSLEYQLVSKGILYVDWRFGYIAGLRGGSPMGWAEQFRCPCRQFAKLWYINCSLGFVLYIP